MAIFNLSDPSIPGPPPIPDPPAPDPVEPHAPGPQEPGSRFPLKTALAIGVVAALLTAWHLKVDPGKGLDPAIVADAFRLHWPARPAPPVPTQPRRNSANLPPPSPIFVDDSNNLDPFFAQLWKLEQNQAGVVTILHYGDSPTTADLITGDIRAQLQARFGDAGRGYTLVAKPWAWYSHRGVDMSSSGWKLRTGVGLIREGVYGLGGAAFEGKPGAWSKFHLARADQTAVQIEYLARPGGGSFTVSANGNQIAAQSTAADSQAAAFLTAELPAETQIVSVQPSAGSVTLFGVDFRRGANGLLYDSLGLNGATTSVLARVMQPDIWKQELDHADPALIVINYGSNESSFSKWVATGYANELRMAIDRIRRLAPNTPILIMSPMDRGERTGLDDIQTMSTIPEIVAIQRQVAAQTHCAFFDTYDAMGSSGTMARWYEASPRLVTADLLHPTPQGATIVAGLFLQQLSLRYDRWKMQHGIAVPAVPAAPALKPARVRAAFDAPHNASRASRQPGIQASTK
ncbi:MAG TPA: GDSL-type esterase/lipase family protein [Terracidiphilus sp.]|nr:GDSL-type esterase/lipase family protein [Terracidiphilus sp.]